MYEGINVNKCVGICVGKTGDLNVGTTEGEGPVALKRGWTPE